jgi:YYY domain-containing protein
MSLAYDAQLLAVLSWLAVLIFLQLSVWPYLKPAFREYAYPISFSASILLFCLVSWYCGLAGMPIPLALVPFAILFLAAIVRKQYTLGELKAQWKWILVFLLFFLFMAEIRFVNPSISYAEKFMDHAFLASIIRDPVVPPLDPWYLGGFMDVYYYLGYWIFGTLAIVSGVPSTIAFNLALPTVLGYAALNMYALGHLLCERFRWLPLATFLMVNPSFIWQMIQGKALGSVMWDSTRTITNTINEFPLFSFLWGDVHAHVIGIFNQVFLIFLLVFAWKRWQTCDLWEKWMIAGCTALSLGSMPLINSWDVIIYAPITVLFGLLILSKAWRKSGQVNAEEKRKVGVSPFVGTVAGFLEKSYGYLILVPILSVVLYLPFYLQMSTSGILGVGIVHNPTVPGEFLLVHGFFLLIYLVYLSADIGKRPYFLLISLPIALAGYPAAAVAAIPLVYLLARKEKTPAELLAILGLLVIITCEFLYLKDNMGETYFRMNTVFKFYIAAWLLMGASSFAMLGALFSRWIPRNTFSSGARRVALIGVIAMLLIVPIALPLDSPYRGATLDGIAYLEEAHPGDAQAVKYLRSIDEKVGLVEAEGGDYTYYSRVSSFTGIPTVIGMPFHEYMWRSKEWTGERSGDVRMIYENPEMTRPLMQKYGANLLYVGELEREQYVVRVQEAGLLPIYDQEGVQIYYLPMEGS